MPVVNYLWDPDEDNVVKELDDAGNTVVDHTTEPFLYGDVISQHRDGQSRFYHFDTQGNTNELTDTSGNVTDTRRYSAFGETTESTGSTKFSFQYGGRLEYYLNQETEDYVVRVRLLSSLRSRWLSPDRLGSFADINVFRYVRNNANLLDPSGYGPCDPASDLDRLPASTVATIYCHEGSMRPVLISGKPLPPELNDPCVSNCLLTHEQVHVGQFRKLCPEFCGVCSNNHKVPSFPRSVSNKDYECPAYEVEYQCLHYYFRNAVNCDRNKLISRFTVVWEIALEFKCDWAIPRRLPPIEEGPPVGPLRRLPPIELRPAPNPSGSLQRLPPIQAEMRHGPRPAIAGPALLDPIEADVAY